MSKGRFGPTIMLSLVVALACAACDLFNKDNSPTSPTSGSGSGSTPRLDSFVGSWASATITPPSATSCGNLTYIVTAVSPTTANVSFTATCAGNLQVSGTGTGTLNGSSLNWTAQGTVSQGGVSCPFSFQNSTATPEGTAIRVNYNGTVCGVSVSGSELLNKK
ncbi:MAG: hypothetical protein HYS05_01295 [Acidobacteria bacterium]|nr:hypothetical protein [Acidobacteriota bacterium]